MLAVRKKKLWDEWGEGETQMRFHDLRDPRALSEPLCKGRFFFFLLSREGGNINNEKIGSIAGERPLLNSMDVRCLLPRSSRKAVQGVC